MAANGNRNGGGGRLAGKTAVVTGGTTGIGLETARQFIQQGARVVITGVNEARLEQAARELGATAVRADVRSVAELDALAERVRAELGHVDILFANAGIGGFGPVDAVTEAAFDDIFAVNVKGAFFTIQKLLPLMDRGGSIIINASAVSEKGGAMVSVYFATKAAVRSLVRSLAAELAPRGIRVNAVSPGWVPTEFGGKLGLPPEALDAFVEGIKAAAPLNRVGSAAEIAPAVVFLASDESAYVTAEELRVDGGWASV